MDRRQQKTRAAILAAFGRLLAEKRYGDITVREIIDDANVGRTTFYAHFATKDLLLKALCEALFGHIVDSASDRARTYGLYSDSDAPESIFCHLLQHLRRLREEGSDILRLLACENNEPFLRYFRESLSRLIQSQCLRQCQASRADIPQDFLINHISGSFVEMVLWWARGGMRQTPEELDRCFRAVIEPALQH